MNKPEEAETNHGFEQKIRPVFQVRDPDPVFIDGLQKKLADRFKDLERISQIKQVISRPAPRLDNHKLQFSPFAWGAIGIIFILALMWGIKTLIPRLEPVGGSKSTPLPSEVATVMPTQSEGAENVIHLPVSSGMAVPLPDEAITSMNASQITELARWGRETIATVAWSPDGKSFAVASASVVHIYDSATLKEINSIGNGSSVNQVAYSPDGTKLATDFNSTSVKIWDVASGSELMTLSGHKNFIIRIGFSPDGGNLASAAYEEPITLWAVSSGEALRTINSTSASNFVFSPDGAFLATAENSVVRLWDVANGEEIRSFTGHTDYIYGLAISPDGTMLASTSNDLTIKVWDVSTGNELKTFNDQALPSGVAFLPDNNTLVTIANGEPITLWDITSGQVLRTIGNGILPATNIVLSTDGKRVLSYSIWEGDAIRLLDIASGEELGRIDWLAYIATSVATSPDGRTLAVGLASGAIKLLDATNGRELLTLPGHTKEVETVKYVLSLAFSPDGSLLASGAMDTTTRLWDVSNGEELDFMDGVKEFGWSGGKPSVDFSPDGKFLAFAGPSGQVKVWDVVNHQELRTLGGQTDSAFADAAAAVAFSPDGKILASGYASGSITLWDATNWSILSSLPVRVITNSNNSISMAFSQDGEYLATVAIDGKIEIWDVANASLVRTFSFPEGQDAYNVNLAISPAADVVAADTDAGTIKLWSIDSGQELNSFDSPASELAFSPDGKVLVSGSYDGAIHLWGLAPGNTVPEEAASVASAGAISAPTAVVAPVTVLPTQIVPEAIGIEKSPIPVLLTSDSLQPLGWSPAGSYYSYSQQGPVGEPGPDQAITTLYFLNGLTGETCQGIQETVTFSQTEWGPSPLGAALYERIRWLDDNHMLYISPSGELLSIKPCSDAFDNWSASVPDVLKSVSKAKEDGTQFILQGEQAFWLFTRSTQQSVRLDIPLPEEDTYTSVGWIPGEAMLYSGRIEDRQSVLWIVLERIDPNTGSASQILEVEASPEVRNSKPMWTGIEWMSNDKVIVENALDGMKLYDLSSQSIQSTNLFPDLFGIEYPGMLQMSAWGAMCEGDEQEIHLMIETGFAPDGQYYIYHPDTGAVDQYPLDPPLLVVFPCGEGGIAKSFTEASPQNNTYKVILVDSGKEPYDLVAKGHTPGQNAWSIATILPGAQQVMFSSTQGISLVDSITGETLNFWGLENPEKYLDFTAILSPDGKSVVGIASLKGENPGQVSNTQDMYWVRLEP